MLIDTAALEEGHELKADVCIVGGGAAGISIARALMGSGLQVLLLEGGGFDPSGDSQALYVAETKKPETLRNYLGYSRLRYFGGSTNHWYGWCRPLQAHVFEKRAWVPHSGWPIRREDLNPWYDKACAVVEIPVFPTPETLDDAHTPPLKTDPSRLQTRLFHYSPPTRFGTVYRDELVDAENVRLMLDANVLRIRADPAAKTVTHLELRTMNGQQLTAKARGVVLATGGIENARLLLLSDSEQPEGLGNGRDLVGRFFCDHPEVDVGQAYVSPNARLYANQAGKPSVRGVLVPPPSLLEEEQILSGAIQLLPLEAEDKPETELGDGVAQLVSATYGVDHKRRKSHMFRARVVTEAAPNPDSRIVLGEDLDAFGQRRIELSWNLTELDTKTLRAHLEVATRELGRTLAGRIRGLQGPWTQHIKPGQHHMGTTRMAEDPASGVVDAHCRVHGIDNLWIAGSSVFPTSGFANPTLTLVALALRLADHLKTELAP